MYGEHRETQGTQGRSTETENRLKGVYRVRTSENTVQTKWFHNGTGSTQAAFRVSKHENRHPENHLENR